jgi:hypothetical protein
VEESGERLIVDQGQLHGRVGTEHDEGSA